MTTHESSVLHHNHHHLYYAWLRFGMKMPLAILISLFLLVAIWYTAPSTLSPTRLSPAQLQAFLSSPAVLEAQKPPNAPPQPSLATVTPEESQQSANKHFNNISSSAGETLQSSSEFNETSQQVPQDQGQAPLSSTEIIFNSSSTNSSLSTVFDELEVDPLNPEPLSPIASRWNSDTGTTNYDFGPSPSPGLEPELETKFIPLSNVSALLQGPKTEVDDKPEDEDIEIYTISMGTAQDSVNNENFLSPAPAAAPFLEPSSPTYLDEYLLEPEPKQPEKRYMFPMLSSFVGTGNQLMEYKSAAVIARTLNRTLCLVPFFGGPQRHSGYLGTSHYGLHIEDRYNLKELSRFVKLANISECIQQCNGTIDRVWRLRSSRSSNWSGWFPRINWEGVVNFDRRFGKWSSPAEIARDFGQLNEEPQANCVGLGGAFPGLRWRGGMWAASAYTVHTENIMNATNKFQARVLGTKPYISVHWRFEESNCKGHRLGLCFTRCGDGALIGGGLKSPRYMDLPTMMGPSHAGAGFHGAGLTKEDVAAALYDKAKEVGVGSVYLSTDGWLRGNDSQANIKWVVEEIRRRGLKVSGLWEIAGLPNFSDGNYVLPKHMPLLFGLQGVKKVSNNMIALVEQEICARSVVFLGSGQSSWSLAVFDSRRSRRRRLDVEESVRRNMTGSPPLTEQDVDEVVIGHLYEDKHAAGPACHGIMGGTPETYEDEAPDGWLDYEACEKRIDLGGKCVRLVAGITQ